MLEPVQQHSRCYEIADLTIQVNSSLPFQTQTFSAEISKFEAESPGYEILRINHHFSLPSESQFDIGKLVYHRPPWRILWRPESWVYIGILPEAADRRWYKIACFNPSHTEGEIYSPDGEAFLEGNLHSLTTFPTDQILLARILADRQGCYLHAAGLVIDGQGFAFVGHSEAGKTTLTRQLMPFGEVLCDDRVIIRNWPDGFKVYGTWSHGDIPLVSPASAPLRALLLLEQAPENRLLPVEPRQVIRLLPQYIVRPLVTKDWWEKTLDLVGAVARQVPVYRLRFDTSGRVIETLRELIAG